MKKKELSDKRIRDLILYDTSERKAKEIVRKLSGKRRVKLE